MKKRIFIQVTAMVLSFAMIVGFILPGVALQAQTALLSATADTDTVIFIGSSPNRLRALLISEGEVILARDGGLGIFQEHSPFVIEENTRLIIQTELNIHSYAEIIVLGELVVQNSGRLNNQGAGSIITIGETGALYNFGHVENVTGSTINNDGLIANNNSFEVQAGVVFNYFGRVAGSSLINVHPDAVVIYTRPPVEIFGPSIKFTTEIPHGEVGTDRISIHFEAFVDPGYYISEFHYSVNGRSTQVSNRRIIGHEHIITSWSVLLDFGANIIELTVIDSAGRSYSVVSENVPYNGYTFRAPTPDRANERQVPGNRYRVYRNNRLRATAQVGITPYQVRNIIEPLNGRIIGQRFIGEQWYFTIEVPVSNFERLYTTANRWAKAFRNIFSLVRVDMESIIVLG